MFVIVMALVYAVCKDEGRIFALEQSAHLHGWFIPSEPGK